MDESLQKLLDDVKKYVKIEAGEYPLFRIHDALIVAIRAGVLFRWVLQGDTYFVRWDSDDRGRMIHKSEIRQALMERIVEVHAPQEGEPEPVEEAAEPHEYDMTDAAAALVEEYSGAIELYLVEPTGKNGRITVGDVRRYLSAEGFD